MRGIRSILRGNENTPYLHPDGQTLYFSSNGHPGMGEEDLFYARRQPTGEWGVPVNLGYPINTKAHEGALFISLDGKEAFFATDRMLDNPNSDEILSQTDIYSFELYPEARPLPVTYLKAVVTDAATKLPLFKAKIELTDLTTGKTYMTALTREDGEFLACLPIGKDYALNVAKEKYLFYSENFNLSNITTLDKPFIMQIELAPIKETTTAVTAKPVPSAPVVLKNVFFDSGSSKLKPTSFTELQNLKKLLSDNPQLKIRINGHTDDVGSDSDNLALSNDRAKAVYDYLIQNGIDASRLSFKGFGETQPIAENSREEGKQLNRRTEFEVVL